MKGTSGASILLYFALLLTTHITAMEEEDNPLPLFLQKHLELKSKKTSTSLKQNTQKTLTSIEKALKTYNNHRSRIESYQNEGIKNDPKKKDKALEKMEMRRKSAKPSKKIDILDELKIAQKQNTENTYICLAYDELKVYDTIDLAPPPHIEKALTLLSLDNVPEAQTLRHALQQELCKRSNLIYVLKNYKFNSELIKEMTLIQYYKDLKLRHTNFDNDQKEYIQLLHLIVSKLKSLPDTYDITYAVNQRLTWYKKYNNDTK